MALRPPRPCASEKVPQRVTRSRFVTASIGEQVFVLFGLMHAAEQISKVGIAQHLAVTQGLPQDLFAVGDKQQADGHRLGWRWPDKRRHHRLACSGRSHKQVSCAGHARAFYGCC